MRQNTKWRANQKVMCCRYVAGIIITVDVSIRLEGLSENGQLV